MSHDPADVIRFATKGGSPRTIGAVYLTRRVMRVIEALSAIIRQNVVFSE
jgi:hypothetical protein